MPLLKSDIAEWLSTVESEDAFVAVDDGGLCLVEIGEDGRETGNYCEVGGHTPPDSDEDEQQRKQKHERS